MRKRKREEAADAHELAMYYEGQTTYCGEGCAECNETDEDMMDKMRSRCLRASTGLPSMSFVHVISHSRRRAMACWE